MTNYYFAFCQGDVLLTTEGNIPFGDTPPISFQPWEHVTDIQADGCCCHVYRLERPIVGKEGLQMMPLRASFDVLSQQEYALAGKAAELIYWDQNTKYCGCCGAPMKLHTPISKRCSECGKEVWPQLATAVIVRITRFKDLRMIEEGTQPQASNIKSSNAPIEEVLLVHANNFRRPYYGLVAGFVETGETLEEAVRREVREETGIEITDIRYFGSQPWPYPCGLMVGFTAKYVSGDIHLQRSELSKGGWFTRDNMPPIPGKSSIARALIDDWLQAADCRDTNT